AMASAAAAHPVAAPPPVAAVTAVPAAPGAHVLTTLHLRSPLILTASTTAAPTRAPTAAATLSVYVVQRRDWPGHIGERYLGDFDRYPEIAALNPDLEARDHRFPDHIEGSWRIVLPADAHDRGPRLHATGHVLTDPGGAGGTGGTGRPSGPAIPAPTVP